MEVPGCVAGTHSTESGIWHVPDRLVVMDPPPACHYEVLTVLDLLSIARQHQLTLPNDARRNKASTIGYLRQHATEQMLVTIRSVIEEKRTQQAARRQDAAQRRLQTQNERRTENASGSATDGHDSSKYLALPTEEEYNAAVTEFYNATSNAALASAVCAVCGREVSRHQDRVEEVMLSELRGRETLRPQEAHPAHDLYDGCLLEPAGVKDEDGIVMISTCRACREHLQRNTTAPPKLSLANHLWIGRIPWQLQTLTIPEQLLIAHLYPRVYVFKLYPKGATWSPGSDTLQRAMRGTVSTYDLSLDDATRMLEGQLLPQKPSVLASVISVTFIGVSTTSQWKRWMRTTFCVRRHHVSEALRWLQTNNARYYGNIEISADRLAALPEQDVPCELLGVVRHCSDAGIATQEGAGYVPEDDDEDPEHGHAGEDEGAAVLPPEITGQHVPYGLARKVPDII